jgi:type IV secretory pathway VirJ component
MKSLRFLNFAFCLLMLPAGAQVLPDSTRDSLKDLPLIEVPAEGASQSDLLAVHLTGDGGWGVTDRGLATTLAKQGIPVVGLNSLKYFWKHRTPEEASADLDRILQHYLTVWNKKRAIIIGYSFGADALPFLLTRLPEQTRRRIELVTFLGLGSQAEFEFHFGNWLGLGRHSSQPVQPEVEKLKGEKMVCFYGLEDSDALCRQLPPSLVRTFPLKTGHRIGANFEPIAEEILREVNRQPALPVATKPATTMAREQNP